MVNAQISVSLVNWQTIMDFVMSVLLINSLLMVFVNARLALPELQADVNLNAKALMLSKVMAYVCFVHSIQNTTSRRERVCAVKDTTLMLMEFANSTYHLQYPAGRVNSTPSSLIDASYVLLAVNTVNLQTAALNVLAMGSTLQDVHPGVETVSKLILRLAMMAIAITMMGVPTVAKQNPILYVMAGNQPLASGQQFNLLFHRIATVVTVLLAGINSVMMVICLEGTDAGTVLYKVVGFVLGIYALDHQ